MTFQDFSNGLATDLLKNAARVLVGLALTGSAGGIGWLVSTTNEHTAQLSEIKADIRNLGSLERDSRLNTDSAISRIVDVQEQEDKEIAALQQAMRDRERSDGAIRP